MELKLASLNDIYTNDKIEIPNDIAIRNGITAPSEIIILEDLPKAVVFWHCGTRKEVRVGKSYITGLELKNGNS
ncbi:MAG TPA: hypothetical protein DF296_13210 [Candidatus Margulisbacteria bacterium]|nr:hypothetical protein [Candidatus Margulisiibacteriota bacterium]